LAIALLMGYAFRGLLYALLLVPWAIPTVVAARIWERIYNADYGVFNYLLGVFFNWLGSPARARHARSDPDGREKGHPLRVDLAARQPARHPTRALPGRRVVDGPGPGAHPAHHPAAARAATRRGR
jgi:hypothetical protein